MTTTSTTLGQRIRHHRNQRGMSVEKLRDRVLTTVPARYVPGAKTFYRIEADEMPEDGVDGILITGIASVLGVRTSQLSQQVADENDQLGDLLGSSSRWITTLDGQLEMFAAAA